MTSSIIRVIEVAKRTRVEYIFVRASLVYDKHGIIVIKSCEVWLILM